MVDEDRSVGRAYLVKQLRERGLSRRQSVRILNFIFAAMSEDLKRGRSVEFPLGKLRRVKRHFGKRWEAVDDWPANRQRYTVEWELDDAGWRVVNGERRPKKGPARPGKSGK